MNLQKNDVKMSPLLFQDITLIIWTVAHRHRYARATLN